MHFIVIASNSAIISCYNSIHNFVLIILSGSPPPKFFFQGNCKEQIHVPTCPQLFVYKRPAVSRQIYKILRSAHHWSQMLYIKFICNKFRNQNKQRNNKQTRSSAICWESTYLTWLYCTVQKAFQYEPFRHGSRSRVWQYSEPSFEWIRNKFETCKAAELWTAFDLPLTHSFGVNPLTHSFGVNP